MKKNTAIAVIVALIVVFGLFTLFTNNTVPLVEENLSQGGKASMVPYANQDFGLAFEYPSNLYLKERTDVGSPLLAVVLVEDTQEHRDLLDGKVTDAREGSIGITVDVYENPGNLSASDWVKNDTNWVVANSTAEPITVGTHEGVTYTWSGLYEGKTVVLTQGTKAYVFSVTWMDPEDQMVRDFEMVLNSFSI